MRGRGEEEAEDGEEEAKRRGGGRRIGSLTVAIAPEVWRDMASDIYDVWNGTFGPRAARERAARLPP
eukprot:699075-Pyramimonas_sp.AAC.1